MDMPDNLDDMTMKEVKEFVAKQQEKIDLKKQAVQKLCWDEIGEVCKKYNCRIKPVVKLNEMQDGYYTFYADLVVVPGELDEQSDDGESASKSDGGSEEGMEGVDEKLDTKKNDERRNGDNESTGEKNNEV